MKNKNIVFIKAIGVANIFLGLIALFPFLKLLWLTKFNLGYSSDLPNPCLMFVSIIIISFLLPLAKCITGYGLIRLKEWGRQKTIFIVLLDFIVRFFGAINVCMYSFLYLPMKPIAEGNYVCKISMYPSYLIAFFNLFVIFILSRKISKELFNKT